MGSNRVPQTTPSVGSKAQTHTPCGSSLSPSPALDCSSSLVKSEPVTEMDVALTVSCHSGNWEESYQDLSAWCNKKMICSPAICLMPVTDESPLCGSEFQGEIDFDLRKSEEIASIPLEEDSCNWWGADSQTLGKFALGDPLEPAAFSKGKSGSVLINDCWLYESEANKIAKGSQSDQTSTVTTTSPESTSSSISGEEKANGKPTMNLQPSALPALPEMLKMELQQNLERVASHLQPGGNSRNKAADLMKILHEQMAILNKKYRAPAAVSDLHNHRAPPQVDSSTLFSSSDNTEEFFKFDPFENLFTPPVRSQSAQQSNEHQFASDLLAHHTSAAPEYVQSAFHPVGASAATLSVPNSKAQRPSDVFNNAHQDIIKAGLKQSPGLNLIRSPATATHRTNAYPGVIVKKKDKDLFLQLPPQKVLPEVELNFDAIISEPQSAHLGIKLEQEINTPEVLKSLVDTPDPESFDLLSYLCDDKVNTPPVCIEQNPFQFPQPSTSQSSYSCSFDQKRNVMVVRPLAASVAQSNSGKDKESAVTLEAKPSVSDAASNVTKSSITEENTPSQRPSRSPQKRKYSDDYVMSPSSPTEERTWTGRRKKPSSSKTDSDEEFTPPVKKSRRKSVIAPLEEEETEIKKRHPKTVAKAKRKEGSRTTSTSSESDKYRELRDRNNEASRKSRLTRKAREQELGHQADILTKENGILKVKVEEMENLVKKLREALLQSMMKKS